MSHPARLLRFTTRRWMILVAVAALLLTAGILGQRAVQYRRQALAYEETARLLDEEVRSLRAQFEEKNTGDPGERTAFDHYLATREAARDDYAAAGARFRQASLRPWVATPPAGPR